MLLSGKRCLPPLIPFGTVRLKKHVDSRQPQYAKHDSRREEQPELDSIVKEAAVVDALNQIRTAVGNLEYIASRRV